MYRKLIMTLAAALAVATGVFAQVIIDPSVEIGPIKCMNAVNNGPRVAPASQKKGNFESYTDACFPYARLHDAPLCAAWAHCVDIDCVFPDFNADENKAESYDFALTDKLIADILRSGTRVFYRLGQSIENTAKKYNVYPPRDYKKWARVCEHIILHYNEGWADGFHYGIDYWEIWNEPDLGFRAGRYLRDDSPTWNGSDKDYFRFYETVSKYLRSRFPHLKIGGPALCEDNEWADNFLAYCSKHGVKLDFYSYHLYAGSVEKFEEKNALMKSLLDKYGYSGVEMILNEWNYLSNWTDEYVYTTEVIKSNRGAAFDAAVMQACQDGPVDMLMYYDARPSTSFNGLFDQTTFSTLPAYYAFYAWKKLRELGTQISVLQSNAVLQSDAVLESDSVLPSNAALKSDVALQSNAAHQSNADVNLKDIRFTAAKGDDGRVAVLISFFSNDRNRVAPVCVDVAFNNFNVSEIRSFVTDGNKLYTETPVRFSDGVAKVVMSPDSFMLIELR